MAVTTKVAMLSPSAEEDADVDYFFANLDVEAPNVDYRPTCGNILMGVGLAAIEVGIAPVRDPETRIRAVNTGALVEAPEQTPSGPVRLAGETAIDGAAGTAAGSSGTPKIGLLAPARGDGHVAVRDAFLQARHELRAEGLDDGGAVFGRADLAAIARGFGVAGETVDDLSRLPAMVEAFRRTGGAAVWDIPVSDRVYSPVIRRAHPGIERAAVPSR